jgi:hypothetical protein
MDGGMKMKDIRIFAALAAVAVLFGCSRSEVPGTRDGHSDKMMARATLGEGVKTHFGSGGYRLVWDKDDQIAVNSLYLGSYSDVMARAEELMDNPQIDEKSAGIIAFFEAVYNNLDKRVLDKFTITPNGSGRQSAVFQSNLPFQSMFGKPDSAEDELFLFLPFYPAREAVDPIKAYFIPDVPEDNYIRNIPYPYINVNVPEVQDGVHYDDYQFLMGDLSISSRQALSRTDDMLEFGDFIPLTSILEFTIATAASISATIDHMTITLSTQQASGEPYVSDRYVIAGNAPLFFTFDEPNELRFWNRNSVPLWGSMRTTGEIAAKDGWADANGGKSMITLDFASPVEVGNSPTSQKYYAVMIPSRCSTASDGGNPKLTFDAYNAAGDKILTKTITTSSPEGIEEGKKYSFDLTLDSI